jgi:hypothetical protein
MIQISTGARTTHRWTRLIVTGALLGVGAGCAGPLQSIRTVDTGPGRLVRMEEFDDRTPYGTVPTVFVAAANQLAGVSAVSASGLASRYEFRAASPGRRGMALTEATHRTLEVLGVRVQLGRDFTLADARAGRAVALISADAWKRVFGGRSDVIGGQIWYDKSSAEVVGVIEDGFVPREAFDRPTDGFALDATTFDGAGRDDRAFRPFIRLKPGKSVEALQADIDVLIPRLQLTLPGGSSQAARTRVRVVPAPFHP